MHSKRLSLIASALTFVLPLLFAARVHAQAALLMEEPYGFFGQINPTGHTALYFARICAETPVKLRRCGPGEQGSVIARYQGIAGYDWIAMPVVPYLYSVEDGSDAPDRVNRASVLRLRTRYHEQHMAGLGADVFEGSLVHGGWTQLVGASYERRIYAFRFATSEAQDDAVIARLNGHENRSKFNLLYSNCADFARSILNVYFPRTFRRTIFPDVGITTPRQITFKLMRYAKKHPETQLTALEIPQIPGYRRISHSNKSVSASLMTTGYAVPIALINPYIAGGIFVDYLTRGRYPLLSKRAVLLAPDQLAALTSAGQVVQNPSRGSSPSAGAVEVTPPSRPAAPAISSFKERGGVHE